MRETPIYEQLRGERINADVPSSETGSSLVGRPGRHRLVPDTTGSVAACRPPGPGADFVVHQHALPGIGVQPPGGPLRTAALRGPRAPVPRPARAGQALAHAASSPPTATGVLDLPEAGMVAVLTRNGEADRVKFSVLTVQLWPRQKGSFRGSRSITSLGAQRFR